MIYGGAGDAYNHYLPMSGAPGGYIVKPDKSMEEIDPREESTIKSTLIGYGANLHDCTPPADVLGAFFTADNTIIDVGGTVNFTDASTDGGSPITSWEWTFPGGNPGSYTGQTPPTITYSAEGLYDVTLTVTNANGNHTKTRSQYINVGVINYCEAAGSSNQYSQYIKKVTFGGIEKTSTATPYSDFTSEIANVSVGVSQEIKIETETNYYSDQVLVWIDWNVDGDFDDAGEEVFASAIDQGPYTADITAPVSASTGQTRMRIRLHDTGAGTANDTPCGSSDWGEVEDYTVNVSGLNSINSIKNNFLNIYPNPNNGVFKIVSASKDNNITITNISGQVIYNSISTNYVSTINLDSEKQGVYFIKLVNSLGTSVQKIIIK